jgi:hypothetical protein
MLEHTMKIEEGERQMVLLALAKLSIERPGWMDAIERLALKMDNEREGKPEMLYEFRRLYQGSEMSKKAWDTAEERREAEAGARALAWVRSPAGMAAKKELAALAVSAMYASFDVAMLEEILDVGRKYATETDRDEVRLMNEALAEEIERRKQEEKL